MDKLIKILLPPKFPQKTGGKEQWGKFFGTLGTEFPTDYVKFIESYGTGGIDNFLWILTPFVNDENVNYLGRQKEMINSYIQSKKNFPQYYKHDVYPSSGGYFHGHTLIMVMNCTG